MNVLGFTASLIAAEFDLDADGNVVTKSPWLPEFAEILWGGLASLIVFAMIVKFGGPAIAKGMAARTARIQAELDAAAADSASAASEAAAIRTAKGDIEAERRRILADAEQQAAAVLAEGRTRLAAEVADLEARASAEIAAAGTRAGDELRAEIARLSTAAVDHIVSGSLDDATHQELIEGFITRVGVSR